MPVGRNDTSTRLAAPSYTTRSTSNSMMRDRSLGVRVSQTASNSASVPAASAVSYTISTVPATTTQTVTAGPVSLTGLASLTTYVVRVTAMPAQGTRRPTLVVVAAIDNLVKGAAGQAVQNANLMLGLDETAGLAA